MASFHCAVKSGSGGRGRSHAEYIEREGKYKTADKDDLEHVQTLNLPEWAANSREFWRESDSLERANSSGYREYEIALPREMTPEQRLALVHEFIANEIGDKHVCTFAIHCPLAALEGGEQPHAHIMFSERTHDGIERTTPEHYFKRADGKQPERGGCKKVNSVRKTDAERKADLVDLRERFASLQNKHLEKNGCTDRVTHLSLKARGLEGPLEGHYGPQKAKIVAGLEKAAAALERELKQEMTEYKGLRKEIKDDGIRAAAFARVGVSVGAASRASDATARNLSAASRDLERAKKGARRRVDKRHLDRALGATVGKLELAGQLVRRAVERVGGVVRSVGGAIKQITTNLDRQRADRKRVSPVEIASTTLPKPVEPDASVVALEKAYSICAQWRAALEAAKPVYVRELIVQAQAKGTADRAKHQAHVDTKPLMFGKDKWEAERQTLENRDRSNAYELDKLQGVNYPMLAVDKEALQKALEQRVSRLNPSLALSLPKAGAEVASGQRRAADAARVASREEWARQKLDPQQKQKDGPSR